jgi:Lon protease-like protein
MKIKKNYPNKIAIFPLSSAVFFPRTILPLNIFEDRYMRMIADCMKGERLFGMVQPKNRRDAPTEVYQIGCLGKIISFNETVDKRFVISLSGIIRFRIKNELDEDNLYRKFNVDYSEFLNDLVEEKNQMPSFDRNSLLKKIKNYFQIIQYPIDHNELKKLNLEQLVSTVCMISPFSVAEKQKLIETIKIEDKVKVIDEIIEFNLFKNQETETIQ